MPAASAKASWATCLASRLRLTTVPNACATSGSKEVALRWGLRTETRRLGVASGTLYHRCYRAFQATAYEPRV